jgi:spermidine synthase
VIPSSLEAPVNDRQLKWRVLLLFFASGSSGLMYQVVWLRMLARLLGVTIHATATVVAAFMAGLALGSYLLGRVVDRRKDPLRVYAVLELLIGAAAILVPILLWLSRPVYQAVYAASGGSEALTAGVRVVLSFLILLVPTTLMGGTLPVLTSFLARRENLFGRSFGLLYGLNTGGAVLGVLLSGFLTIGAFGERVTIGLGVLVNLTVGLIAYATARKAAAGRVEALPTAAAPAPSRIISPYGTGVRRAVLLGFALSGFTALAYEIVWTRQLILFLRTSVYAFAGMLAIFLTGLALGSLFISRIVDRFRSPLVVFALLEVAVAGLTVLNLHLVGPLDSDLAHRMLGLTSVVYAVILLVLPLTLVFGMIAPVAAVCYTGSVDGTGSAVGRLYGANTLGSILGSAVAGFVLVPTFGASRTMMTLAFINLALGALFLLLEPRVAPLRRALVAAAALVVLAAALGARDQDPFRSAIMARIERRMGTTWMPDSNASLPASQRIYAHREGVEATLTAFEVNRFKQLWLNGVGMTFPTTATKLIAHLPLQIADDPKEFLAIAFGMGTTVRSASRYDGLSVTAVDLVPETFEVFPFYHKDAAEVVATGRVHFEVNDGRNFLLLAPKRYDVITVDPAPPIWSAGTVNLYTKEFFSLAHDRLTPGGVMCLWFPGGTEEEAKSLIATFLSVFPQTTIWSGPHKWGWYLVGTLKPIDWERFRTRVAATYANPLLAADLQEYDSAAAEPKDLEKLLMWRPDEVGRVTAGAHLITDDYPLTEFPLWRYLQGRRGLWHPRSSWLNSDGPDQPSGAGNVANQPFQDR